MSGVELGLAIIATIDLCFRYGQKLVDLCSSIKNAEPQILERYLRLEEIWVRTRCQITFIRSIWQSMDESYQRVQSQILEVLAARLQAAFSRMRNILQNRNGQPYVTGLHRFKFALCKEGLDKSLADLAAWQNTFDPSWFLIMKIASSSVDARLSDAQAETQHLAITSANHVRDALKSGTDQRVSVFLPPGGLEMAQTSNLPFSSVLLARRHGSSRWLLLDRAFLPANADHFILTRDVRDIARKLRQTDPQRFHLLTCSGVVKNFDSSGTKLISFTFVFKMPDGYSGARSLRDVLSSQSPKHSLSERLQIAKDLATAVAYVHNFGFVHKNIRPETVVLLTNEKNDLGTPYLTGFEAFRSADGRTLKRGDDMWNLNLYRHPDRQGEFPSEEYSMQHDIYSLGVCLLELGLFESFVMYDDDEMPVSLSSKLAVDLLNQQAGRFDLLKDHLVELARIQLPRQLGTRYTDIVITCLTCLDKNNLDFGDERDFQDDDGILVSVRYIEKVLVQLNEINV